jgi:hypothetical protein
MGGRIDDALEPGGVAQDRVECGIVRDESDAGRRAWA